MADETPLPATPALPTTDDQTSVLVAVRVRDPGDPAINRDHPGVQLAVAEYDRSRSPAALAKLRACTHPGRTLVEFHLSPLEMDAVAFATEGTNPVQGVERYIRAFALSCFLVIDGAERIVPEKISAGEMPQITRKAVGVLAKRYGMNAIVEMGALALRRAEVTPGTVDPYSRLAGAPRLSY